MVFLPNFLVLLAIFSVGGAFREAGNEEFPFQVSIKNSEKRHLCGGAIITSNWALTASSCLSNQGPVSICYGSSDSNNLRNCVKSRNIHHQNDFNLFKKSRLALIEFDAPIEFSKTAKQAKLPKSTTELRNTTKLCVWKTNSQIDLPPSLYVSDPYYVIPENCKTLSGGPVTLDIDEFCGMDEDFQNRPNNLGSTVSKNDVVLGILTHFPIAASQPYIFVKVSEHGQWIKDILKSDAEHLIWVDNAWNDSTRLHNTITVTLLGMCALLLHFV